MDFEQTARGREYAEPSITRAEYDAQVLALAHPVAERADPGAIREQAANAAPEP